MAGQRLPEGALTEKRKYRTFTPEQKLGIVLAGLRGEKSAALAKAKAWLEPGEPVLDYNPELATILARRDFLDAAITPEKFVEACRLLSKAAYSWRELKRRF